MMTIHKSGPKLPSIDDFKNLYFMCPEGELYRHVRLIVPEEYIDEPRVRELYDMLRERILAAQPPEQINLEVREDDDAEFHVLARWKLSNSPDKNVIPVASEGLAMFLKQLSDDLIRQQNSGITFNLEVNKYNGISFYFKLTRDGEADLGVVVLNVY